MVVIDETVADFLAYTRRHIAPSGGQEILLLFRIPTGIYHLPRDQDVVLNLYVPATMTFSDIKHALWTNRIPYYSRVMQVMIYRGNALDDRSTPAQMNMENGTEICFF